jgi:hypothetical protein
LAADARRGPVSPTPRTHHRAAPRPLPQVVRRQLARIVPTCHVEVVTSKIGHHNARTLLTKPAEARGGAAEASPPAMAILCLPHAPGHAGAPASDDALSVCAAVCLDSGIRCLPVLYDDVGSAGGREVAHQRLSCLYDTVGCVQARHFAARLRRLGAPAAQAAAMQVVHSSDLAGIRTHRDDAPAAGPPRVSGAAEEGVDARCAVLAGMGGAAASACLCFLAGTCDLLPSSGVYSKPNREDAHKAVLRREREVFQSAEAVDVFPEDLECAATPPSRLHAATRAA